VSLSKYVTCTKFFFKKKKKKLNLTFFLKKKNCMGWPTNPFWPLGVAKAGLKVAEANARGVARGGQSHPHGLWWALCWPAIAIGQNGVAAIFFVCRFNFYYLIIFNFMTYPSTKKVINP
jgi:hypothetical protein